MSFGITMTRRMRIYRCGGASISDLFQVCKQFTEAGFMADADLDAGCLLNKKIRNAQLAQYNFILGEGTYSWFSEAFTWLIAGLTGY